MAEWVRLKSMSVLLKAISLPQVKCMHVSGHVSLLGRAWARLVVTIHIGGMPRHGCTVTIQVDGMLG